MTCSSIAEATAQGRSKSVRKATRMLACLPVVMMASAVCAQDCSVTPSTIRVGEVMRLRCSSRAATASMNGRTVRLFSQPEGDRLGLMPVAVSDTAGVYAIEFLADDGEVIQSAVATVRETRFPTESLLLDPAIAELRSSPDEIQLLAAFRESVTDTRYWEDPFVAPVPGCFTSPFGVKRVRNGKPTGDYHRGVDQRSPTGYPVRAVAAGVIKIAQQFTALGGTVGLDHGQGLETMYLHMSSLLALPSAHVNRGDVIGYVGSTGRSNGPHLHWAIYVNGVPVNPSQWVTLRPCSASASRVRRR